MRWPRGAEKADPALALRTALLAALRRPAAAPATTSTVATPAATATASAASAATTATPAATTASTTSLAATSLAASSGARLASRPAKSLQISGNLGQPRAPPGPANSRHSAAEEGEVVACRLGQLLGRVDPPAGGLLRRPQVLGGHGAPRRSDQRRSEQPDDRLAHSLSGVLRGLEPGVDGERVAAGGDDGVPPVPRHEERLAGAQLDLVQPRRGAGGGAAQLGAAAAPGVVGARKDRALLIRHTGRPQRPRRVSAPFPFAARRRAQPPALGSGTLRHKVDAVRVVVRRRARAL